MTLSILTLCVFEMVGSVAMATGKRGTMPLLIDVENMSSLSLCKANISLGPEHSSSKHTIS